MLTIRSIYFGCLWQNLVFPPILIAILLFSVPADSVTNSAYHRDNFHNDNNRFNNNNFNNKVFNRKVAQHYNQLSPHTVLINKQFERYQPTIQKILFQLKQHQLPQSLILIPMLESAFNPEAVSPAKAAGLWQLMPATAKRFGLNVDKMNDERFDISKSTQAAIKYLSFLYNKFDQDIKLTLAAYNSGEGRVQRALRQQVDKHFSALQLPQETVNYVHKFYALLDIVDVKALKPPASESSIAHEFDAKVIPLVLREQRLLLELFEPRKIINMEPVKPLVPL
ncbi:lytic transglycosylase domain-containing protein [Photobacterium sp.]|uniref:lytic transglycosylase domain-containing protein n=1 Tax=Photobacterium sp. TaxID=660 RepID=UPI00299E7584|nr:lytic transglycosylase domain-containing protein [Photobacterium sp.]MDX1301104.1 lytic transglycosylase domain-containing protein [Photobacterium sp.]